MSGRYLKEYSNFIATDSIQMLKNLSNNYTNDFILINYAWGVLYILDILINYQLEVMGLSLLKCSHTDYNFSTKILRIKQLSHSLVLLKKFRSLRCRTISKFSFSSDSTEYLFNLTKDLINNSYSFSSTVLKIFRNFTIVYWSLLIGSKLSWSLMAGRPFSYIFVD